MKSANIKLSIQGDEMNSDSLLTSSSKLNYRPFNSIMTTTSLTDVSSLSFNKNSTTCSCSTCTCSKKSTIYQTSQLKKIKSDYLNDDCLTYIFIILYESSMWCMQSIYELFFKSLWQVLMYARQELHYAQDDNKTISSVDMMPINNSADENYPLIHTKKKYRELPRYHLSLLQSKIKSTRNNRLRKSNGEDKIILLDKACDSMSIHTSSQCQTVHVDLNQSEDINLREQLADARLHEPLIFMNREMCYERYRSSVFSTRPFHHSVQDISQQPQQLNNKQEFSPCKPQPLMRNRINRNDKPSTINLDLFPISNTRTLTPTPANPTDVQVDKTPLSNNSQSLLHQRKKSKQKQRIIDDKSIPLTLATSLHSNASLYNDDYYLSKYIHKLLIDKHHLR